MNERTLKTIVAFTELSETDEIKEIKRQYLSNEIGAFDFFSLANKYVEGANDKI